MAKKLIITKEQLRKLKAGVIREEQKEEGYFDGRFVSRSEKDKTKYTRKNKHKNEDDI